MIDLNSATLEELLKVPGISRSQAQALLAHRPFPTWRDVERAPGVGEDVVKWLQAVGLRLDEPAEAPIVAPPAVVSASEEATET